VCARAPRARDLSCSRHTTAPRARALRDGVKKPDVEGAEGAELLQLALRPAGGQRVVGAARIGAAVQDWRVQAL
jgi:hypothetical protein